MKLIYLEFFVQVVDAGSISKAANSLFLKQSNLSKYMKTVENYFGTVLFERKYNGIKLTENGEKVYDWACSFLNQAETLRLSFQKETLSENTYSVQPINFYVNPSINPEAHSCIIDFSTLHPNFQLNIIERDIYHMLNKLDAEPNTLMLSILDELFVNHIKENTSLILLPFSTTSFAVYVAHENSVLSKQNSISLKKLKDLPLLIYSPSEQNDSPVLEILSHYTDLNVSKVVSNSTMFHSLLQTGKYISIGIKSSTGMKKNYKEVLIRDTIPLSLYFLLSSASLEYEPIRLFLHHYYNSKKIPFPLHSMNKS